MVASEAVFWLPMDDGRPLKLRRGTLLLLRRSEVASWLAEET